MQDNGPIGWKSGSQKPEDALLYFHDSAGNRRVRVARSRLV